MNNAPDAHCSDSGKGKLTRPFCTIQAAADFASPGQTVSISGQYSDPVTIITSGTPLAPITFDGGNLYQTSTSTSSGQPAIVVQGAHDIRITNLGVYTSAFTAPSDVVLIDNSARITLDHNYIASGATIVSSNAVVHVTGGSSGITVSRNQIGQSFGPAISVEGGNDDTISTNDMSFPGNGGIHVSAAASTAIPA